MPTRRAHSEIEYNLKSAGVEDSPVFTLDFGERAFVLLMARCALTVSREEPLAVHLAEHRSASLALPRSAPKA